MKVKEKKSAQDIARKIHEMTSPSTVLRTWTECCEDINFTLNVYKEMGKNGWHTKFQNDILIATENQEKNGVL